MDDLAPRQFRESVNDDASDQHEASPTPPKSSTSSLAPTSFAGRESMPHITVNDFDGEDRKGPYWLPSDTQETAFTDSTTSRKVRRARSRSDVGSNRSSLRMSTSGHNDDDDDEAAPGRMFSRNTSFRQRGWTSRNLSAKESRSRRGFTRDCTVVEFGKDKQLHTWHVSSQTEIMSMTAKLKLTASAYDERSTTVIDKDQTIYWVQLKTHEDHAFVAFVESLGIDEEEVYSKLAQEGRPSITKGEHSLTIVTTHFAETEMEDGTTSNDRRPALTILLPNIVITICDEVIVEGVMSKLRISNSLIRTKGDASLIFATILGMTMDLNYKVVEMMGDSLADIEEEVLEKVPKQSVAQLQKANIAGRVHSVKRELFELRNILWPFRETISTLSIATDIPDVLLSPRSRSYMHRSKASCLQLINIVETYRETGTSLIELFTAQGKFMLDKQTKFLAMWSFIFLPTTFLTGVYGMNFYQFKSSFGGYQMPEIHNVHGYTIFWIICSIYVIFAFIVFHRQRFIRIPLLSYLKRKFITKSAEETKIKRMIIDDTENDYN